MKENRSYSSLEWLLMGGIAALFIWPFIQLWSVKAVPIFESDMNQKAAVALENLMAEALSGPISDTLPPAAYKTVGDDKDSGLEGKVEILPHPSVNGMMLVRAHVRWGYFFFRKFLNLEAVVTQTRP